MVTHSPDDTPTEGIERQRGSTFAVGQLVAGRYRVLRELGAGGVGEVYEGHDQVLGGSIALKTLRPVLARHPVIAERFRREVLNARRVTHANVCRIFEFGGHQIDKQTRWFFTMELLAGETLASLLERRGPMSTAEALPIIAGIAAGLLAAHHSGVVHRDLKPGNVVVVPATADTEARVVITDFGLAITIEQAEFGLTESSELVGTPEYMAPEQTEPGAATPATDIYALGIIAYELLSKQRPFESAATPVETVLKRCVEPPRPLRTILPAVDPVWEAAILRCLEREPAERFQRPDELVAALAGRSTPPPKDASSGGGLLNRLGRRFTKQ
jgi:serine/threonine protein kinase